MLIASSTPRPGRERAGFKPFSLSSHQQLSTTALAQLQEAVRSSLATEEQATIVDSLASHEKLLASFRQALLQQRERYEKAHQALLIAHRKSMKCQVCIIGRSWGA